MMLKGSHLVKKILIGALFVKTISVFAATGIGQYPAVPGEFIVKFKSNKNLSKTLRELQFEARDVLPEERIYAVKSFPGQKKNRDLAELAKDPNIEYIEPNYIYELIRPKKSQKIAENHHEEVKSMALVQDELFGKQWGLQNTGWNSRTWLVIPGKKGEDVNILDAWKKTKGDRRIIVGVIDTGVDFNHEDLKENLWMNQAELNGKPGVDDDKNGYIDDVYGYNFVANTSAPLDGNGHGTHCAGVIGAVHNHLGVAGVMDDVQIMALKFLSDTGFGNVEGAIKAIDYGVKMGANVLSNSWGGGARSQALEDAITRANAKGVIFVAAAGNDNTDNDLKPSYPANYTVTNVISVGSSDGKGNKSSFSNYGNTLVHVFAPGSNILSTFPKNNYKKLSGTSMATPFVSGAVGLYLSTLQNRPTPLSVRNKVVQSVDKTEALKNLSTSDGRLNIGKLLQ
jgi:thermitase